MRCVEYSVGVFMVCTIWNMYLTQDFGMQNSVSTKHLKITS